MLRVGIVLAEVGADARTLGVGLIGWLGDVLHLSAVSRFFVVTVLMVRWEAVKQ